MNAKQVRERYYKQPWGKLLLEMGWEPYDTESSARRVAEYAAEKIERLEKQIKDLKDERTKNT